MPYPYEQIFAADPATPENVASNGVVTIFAPGDPNRAPLTITTLDGMPLQNPIRVNDAGFGPAFMHATLDQVAWSGGGFTGLFVSYKGIKDEAVAARQSADESRAAAQEAAAEARAPADDAVARGLSRANLPGMIANGVAAQPTVTAAAATAVGAALKGADVITGGDQRVPSIVSHANFASVVTDQRGRIAEGVTKDGRKYTAQADIGEAKIATLAVDNFTQAGQSLTQAPNIQYSQVTTDEEGRIAEDALDLSGRKPDWILEAWAERMTPMLSTAMGITPAARLAAFGDSMTAGDGGSGTSWPAVAAASLKVPFYNGGVSGQSSAEVALRQGGLAVLVTAANDMIPASGPVSVTVTPSGDWRSTLGWTFPGTLAGVSGSLAKDTSGGWTFTRTSSGAAVRSGPGTRFYSAAAEPHNGWISCFWAGRNNLGSEANTIARDLGAMVSGLASTKPRFLVFGVCNSSTEPRGSAIYNRVAALNAQLTQTYGANFFDVRRYLIDSGLAAAGLTPTAADTTALAEDRIPPSLMSDELHLNKAGYTAVGNRVAQIILAKGWIK